MMRALIVAILVASSAVAHADTKRVAVIVGNNAGNADRAALHYAETDAAKLAGVLGELGGVAPEDAFLLQGKSLAAVAEAFARAKQRIAGFRRDPSNHIVLLFYFSGHSDGEALELGGDRLTFSELRRWLVSAGADVRVALVDSCKSGALLSAKGGTPGPGFPSPSRPASRWSGSSETASVCWWCCQQRGWASSSDCESLRSTAAYRVIRTKEMEMKNITAYLLGVLVTGCGPGVSSDPMASNAAPLESEPTQLLANVLTTQAIKGDAENDATYLAIVEDKETSSARLVRQDIRYAEITELDRMPFGKGAVQLVVGTEGIAWGFAGDGSEPATFRIVGKSGATAIPFTDHGPATLLNEKSNLLYYASKHDCAIQPLDLTTGQIDKRYSTSISCFITIESVVQTEQAALIRSSDDPGFSIRGFYKSMNLGIQTLDQGASDFTGPFPSTVEPGQGTADTQNAAWSRMDSDGNSHIMTVSTVPWSLQPNPGRELGIVDGAVDAGAVVHGEFWGATLGEPTILFHLTTNSVRRYTVDYQPRAMFPLHNSLVVLTEDGTLLQQPISADD